MSTVTFDADHNAVAERLSSVVVLRDKGGNPAVTQQGAGHTAVSVRGFIGPRGPAGPAGPAGGATYTHTQSTPAAVWTVAHNLGRRPSITVTDHLGNVVTADVSYLDDDIAQVTHGTPLIGFVYCN